MTENLSSEEIFVKFTAKIGHNVWQAEMVCSQSALYFFDAGAISLKTWIRKTAALSIGFASKTKEMALPSSKKGSVLA